MLNALGAVRLHCLKFYQIMEKEETLHFIQRSNEILSHNFRRKGPEKLRFWGQYNEDIETIIRNQEGLAFSYCKIPANNRGNEDEPIYLLSVFQLKEKK